MWGLRVRFPPFEGAEVERFSDQKAGDDSHLTPDDESVDRGHRHPASAGHSPAAHSQMSFVPKLFWGDQKHPEGGIASAMLPDAK
jgi:hypothetical protein